jgi:hypothetical protein
VQGSGPVVCHPYSLPMPVSTRIAVASVPGRIPAAVALLARVRIDHAMRMPGVPLLLPARHHYAVFRAQRQPVWRARPPVAGEGGPVAQLLQMHNHGVDRVEGGHRYSDGKAGGMAGVNVWHLFISRDVINIAVSEARTITCNARRLFVTSACGLL